MTSSKTPIVEVTMTIDRGEIQAIVMNGHTYIPVEAYQALDKELHIVKTQLSCARTMYERATYLEPNSYMRKAHLKEYDLCIEKIRTEVNHGKSKE